MSLRYPIQIRRRSPGMWIAGRFVDAEPAAPETIMATVQPAVLADYDQMQARLEGRRIEAMVRVYCSERLAVAGEADGVNGDLLDWGEGGHTRPYVFIWRSPWQSRIIPHYRHIAALMLEGR